MNLETIISISGKPGLFKVAGQGAKNLIIEDVETGKKRSAFSTEKVSALSDITIFGYVDDLPLGEVFQKIYDKEGGKNAISHKSTEQELREYFEEAWPEYHDEDVKLHDIKKILKWYNILLTHKLLEPTKEEDKTEEGAKEAIKAVKAKKAKPSANPKGGVKSKSKGGSVQSKKSNVTKIGNAKKG